MSRPVMFDLFCCAGGAAKGYHDAGFDVIGVDINPQPRYPYRFVQADALDYLSAFLTFGCNENVVAIHASPPCQAFSSLSNCVPGTKEKYPNLIPQTRELLKKTELPYVIENVVGSPLDPTVTLCGTSFGKRLRLHRLFEANFPIDQPACNHVGYVLNPYAVAGRARMRAEFPGQTIASIWKREKNVEWMNDKESSEAIMPAYTRYIGQHLLSYLEMSTVEEMAA